MSNKPHGGAAFPTAAVLYPNGDLAGGDGGMSLRDWFAGMAMCGMVAGSKGLEITEREFAVCSYAIADRMLKEREI